MRALRWTTCALALAIFCGGQASAGLIDDFSDGSLAEYTSTVILDANGGASNVAAWQSPSGTLELSTTTYDGIQQYAFIRNGLTLPVGHEVQVDRILVQGSGTQDLGLYVGGTLPVAGVRQDYVAIYGRNNGQVFSRGFDGAGEFGLAGGGSPAYDSLFIARTSVNTYETGYYSAGVRNILATRTPAFANDGDVVGFYADVRGAGTLGALDNFRMIPEPSSAALATLGLAAVGFARRRKK